MEHNLTPSITSSEKLRNLETPLLASLAIAEGSYSQLSAVVIFNTMKGRLRDERLKQERLKHRDGPKKQVLTLIGGTRAGKTSLLGEMAEYLSRSGYKGAVITYDGATAAAKALEKEFGLGKMDLSHADGQYSPEEYHFISGVMEKAVSLALQDKDVQYILVETPATTGFRVKNRGGDEITVGKDRGTSSVRNISQQRGELSGLSYDDCYIHLIPTEERRTKGYETRVDLVRQSKSPLVALTKHGITFHGSNVEDIQGGSIEGTGKVDIDEIRALQELVTMRHIQLPQRINDEDVDIVTRIMARSFAPWFFGKYLGVQKSRVANAINSSIPHPHLYQNTMTQLDYIQKMLVADAKQLIPSQR